VAIAHSAAQVAACRDDERLDGYSDSDGNQRVVVVAERGESDERNACVGDQP
jgi:hypothetical protein